jgi:hypothetical protein
MAKQYREHQCNFCNFRSWYDDSLFGKLSDSGEWRDFFRCLNCGTVLCAKCADVGFFSSAKCLRCKDSGQMRKIT